jgi:hypothetical protein
MKPSIGRIVHFVQNKPSGFGEGVRVHLPAIITAVWGDTCVNLRCSRMVQIPSKGQTRILPP